MTQPMLSAQGSSRRVKAQSAEEIDVEDAEVAFFIRALKLRHGYDFGGYAQASLRRRIEALVASSGVRSITALTERVLHEPSIVQQVIDRLAVPVSEMFRDPQVFQALRTEVMPVLASYPQINIWQAGCAHGEEVYSLAILLKECGLYNRSQIFATDFSDAALTRAQQGIYPIREARLYSENYLESGGMGSLSDWYTAGYQHIKLNESLKERVTFANHNLVSDGVFAEVHLILCRNVLIYFGDALQDQVIGLFRDSLVRGGYLCLGTKESLEFSGLFNDFRKLQSNLPVYRRIVRPEDAVRE